MFKQVARFCVSAGSKRGSRSSQEALPGLVQMALFNNFHDQVRLVRL